MPILDFPQPVGLLRAEGDQQDITLTQFGVERLGIIRERDVARRATGEAEEDEERRSAFRQAAQRQFPAVHFRKDEVGQQVAGLGDGGGIETLDQQTALASIGFKLRGGPGAFALGLKGGIAGLEGLSKDSRHHRLLALT